MSKVLAVVMAKNIYLPNEDGEKVKFEHGAQVEIDRTVAEEVLSGDKAADRAARLTLVEIDKPKRGRPKKVAE